MRKIKELKFKLDLLQDQLYMLHFAEPNPEMYDMKKSEIEYEIASIEHEIEFQSKMIPFRYTLYAFIVFSISLLMYAFVKTY
jgi:hypothetical protein